MHSNHLSYDCSDKLTSSARLVQIVPQALRESAGALLQITQSADSEGRKPWFRFPVAAQEFFLSRFVSYHQSLYHHSLSLYHQLSSNHAQVQNLKSFHRPVSAVSANIVI